MRSLRIQHRLTAAALGCVVSVLSACDNDPAAPVPTGASAVVDASSIALACAPASLRVPRGSTTTVSCTITTPKSAKGSLSFRGAHFPQGVSLHLVGADTTNTLAPGTSTTVYLAADVGATVAAGHYDGTLVAQGRGGSQRIPLALDVTTFAARVRMVYLVPSDRVYDPDVAWGMERAVRHLQIFFQEQLGGSTFALHLPVVEVVRSSRPASDFTADAFGAVGQEVWASLGGGFYDQANIWAVYFDVAPIGATGGAASLATLPHGDVIGIIGGDATQPIRRWIGGLGHEVGHAMGLPHPPGCDAGIITQDCYSLMYYGYLAYPNTFMTLAQQQQLLAGPYVSTAVTTTPSLFDADAWGPVLFPASSVTAAATGAAPALVERTATDILRRERLLVGPGQHAR